MARSSLPAHLISLVIMAVCVACSGAPSAPQVQAAQALVPSMTLAPAQIPTDSPTLTSTPSSTPTPTDTPTITPSPTRLPPTATPTPKPLAGWGLDDLRARSFGGSGVEIVQTLGTNARYTRYQIRYPSDGLTVSGIMTVPRGHGPFPVLVLNHGYIPPWEYKTGANYFNIYVDAFAPLGFIVLDPDYRNHGYSDCGYNPFDEGHVIDLLNLMAQVSSIPKADPSAMVMFGHSRGGGLVQKVAVVTDTLKAAVAYSSISADTRERNRVRPTTTRFPTRSPSVRCYAELTGPPVPPEQLPDVYERVDAYNYLQFLKTPISIHHGEKDEQVDLIRSQQLRDRLTAAGKTFEYFTYPNQLHNFSGAGFNLLIQRSVVWFNKYLPRKAVPS